MRSEAASCYRHISAILTGYTPFFLCRVIVLDHHKTAAEQLQGGSVVLPDNVDVLLDMDRSGATIALDFFKPKGLSEQLQKTYK